MSSDNPHNRRVETDDSDPVDRMLEKAGCSEYHYKVQECMVDHGDWRKCKEQVQAFKKCIRDSQAKDSSALMLPK